MKKFFDRLRRWLIKKLGGYSEQYTPIQREIVQKTSIKTHKLVVQTSVTARMGSAFDYKRYCECELLERIMKNLYESGFILWEREEDVFRQKMNVRATVYFVDANDMALYKSWRG